CRKIAAAPVDVEVEHGHRRLIRRPLAPLARERGVLQGLRDAPRAVRLEDGLFEIESIALLRDIAGPLARRRLAPARLARPATHSPPVLLLAPSGLAAFPSDYGHVSPPCDLA